MTGPTPVNITNIANQEIALLKEQLAAQKLQTSLLQQDFDRLTQQNMVLSKQLSILNDDIKENQS